MNFTAEKLKLRTQGTLNVGRSGQLDYYKPLVINTAPGNFKIALEIARFN